MENNNLNNLKKADLEILKVFIKICEDNNLRYYVCYGTFLGAVRHQGFIPWDDDVDVAMPRPDYEKFFEIAPLYLPPDLYLSTYKNGEDHISLSSMLASKEKNFTLNNADKVIQTGAWIDILAIDGAPKSSFSKKIFLYKFIFRRSVCQLAHFSKIVNLKKKRPLYQRIIIRIAKTINIENHLDGVKAGKKFHELLSKIPYDQAEEVASFQGDDQLRNEGILPKEVYGEGKLYHFEDIMVVGPADFETYLTAYYGDWRTPPSADYQNIHNVKET